MRGETLAARPPAVQCRPGSPGRMLGVVFGVLFVLFVVRQVGDLAGANDGRVRFVEISMDEPNEASPSPRGLSASGSKTMETSRVSRSPPPPPRLPVPALVDLLTEKEETVEETVVKAVVKTPEPETAEKKPDAKNETFTQNATSAKTLAAGTEHVPVAAIGGGFHIKQGHIVDTKGEVIGKSVVVDEMEGDVNKNNETTTTEETNPLKASTNAATKQSKTTEIEGRLVVNHTATSFSLTNMDPSCGAEDALDLDGPALSWGIDFRVKNAGECCAACKAKTSASGDKNTCNSWVFCPGGEHTSECWAPDIWNHTIGECWLKVQANRDEPVVNFRGDYPLAFRKQHATAPKRVAWQAGVLRWEQ